MTNYTMKERTYRYFTKQPLWPFGFGLYVPSYRLLQSHPLIIFVAALSLGSIIPISLLHLLRSKQEIKYLLQSV